MVEPFLWAGCQIRFYNVGPHLDPDPDSFERQLASVDAVLLTRYFGFDCAATEYGTQARRAGKLVIEDLAHSAFSDHITGDIAITSLSKFFACDEGAELFVADDAHYRTLNASARALRQTPLVWRAKDTIRRLWRRIPGTAQRDTRYRYFDTLQMTRPVERATPQFTGGPPDNCISTLRRAHYLRLETVVAKTYPAGMICGLLPTGIVPYVFPLLLRRASDFHTLRQAGIPIQRWEELASTGCEVSCDYRHKLVQLPIHQAITSSQMADLEEVLGQYCKPEKTHGA